MFEFPEDGAFIKEGRYYTLEAASLSLPEKREKKKKRTKRRKKTGEKGRWINSREERERKGGFTLSLTPGYSPRRIPWYPSPLTTAISSRLIRLLSLFVPRNSPLSFPSLSPWDVSTAASISLVEQSRTDLFLGWTNRPALTPRQLLSPRFNFSSNGYARKGGGLCNAFRREEEKSLGKVSQLSSVYPPKQIPFERRWLLEQVLAIVWRGEEKRSFFLFFSGCFERIFFWRPFVLEREGWDERETEREREVIGKR